MALRHRINRQIRKMPKYRINKEVFDNQNIARSRAYGRDRSVQIAQEDIDAQTAESVGYAKDATSSTAGLLAALADINNNNTQAKRSLAQDEASIQAKNVQDLINVNNMVSEEKDKAWYHNVYSPWDAKLRALQQQRANRTAFFNNLVGGLTTLAGTTIAGPVGGAIANRIGSRFGKRNDVSTIDANNVDLMDSGWS